MNGTLCWLLTFSKGHKTSGWRMDGFVHRMQVEYLPRYSDRRSCTRSFGTEWIRDASLSFSANSGFSHLNHVWSKLRSITNTHSWQVGQETLPQAAERWLIVGLSKCRVPQLRTKSFRYVFLNDRRMGTWCSNAASKKLPQMEATRLLDRNYRNYGTVCTIHIDIILAIVIVYTCLGFRHNEGPTSTQLFTMFQLTVSSVKVRSRCTSSYWTCLRDSVDWLIENLQIGWAISGNRTYCSCFGVLRQRIRTWSEYHTNIWEIGWTMTKPILKNHSGNWPLSKFDIIIYTNHHHCAYILPNYRGLYQRGYQREVQTKSNIAKMARDYHVPVHRLWARLNGPRFSIGAPTSWSEAWLYTGGRSL